MNFVHKQEKVLFIEQFKGAESSHRRAGGIHQQSYEKCLNEIDEPDCNKSDDVTSADSQFIFFIISLFESS